ncbi:MAG TPA: AAA family ATPase [Polyangia bacterium]|nr:AAA family ATPase [Polyangia bacterium]
MKNLWVEGVRAFRQRAEAPLGKITLLVGQNSTGKSTFLACARIAWDIATRGEADFNEQPFELGTYDSIAHYHGGRGARVTEFTIGAQFPMPHGRRTHQQDLPGLESRSAATAISVEGTFRADHGSPALVRWKIDDGALSASVIRRNGKIVVNWTASDSEREFEFDAPVGLPFPYVLRVGPSFSGLKDNDKFLWQLSRSLMDVERAMIRPSALAPVRSRPRRTYDPIRDRPSPEGEHIPALLSRLQAQGGHQWEGLSQALKKFGQESQLFSEVSVRSLGKEQQGEPFQIQVSIPGQKGPRNLIDVGYGVSQVLPILVESALGPKGQMLLLQQPEVHLHPQAQAALGTYLARAAGAGTAQYIIETHSDYLVDRIAMAIRDSEHPLKAKDVSLLFFEADESGICLHRLTFNENGEIVNAPVGYRQFFLDEQARFLGVD